MEQDKKVIERMYKEAVEARGRAYAPYSKFLVGASFMVEGMGDRIYSGCNVENVSYGATVCAERVAIYRAVGELGRVRFKGAVVVTDMEEPVTPCGECLQVMVEFCVGNMPVYIGNLSGIKRVLRMEELAPHAFNRFEVVGR